MSREYVYHSVVPDTQKDTYASLTDIDFSLTFEGRKMVLNSVRFEADLNVLKDGAIRPVTADDVKFDHMVGGHCFIENITTTLQNVGQIENMQSSYNRIVKMVADATMTEDDCLNGDMVCELRSSTPQVAVSYCQGIVPPLTTALAGTIQDVDFSIKPYFCLNRAMGEGEPVVSFRKSGVVSISVKLARVSSSLYGETVGATSTFFLKNPRISFLTVDDDGADMPVMMRKSVAIKTSVVSNQSNISVQPPAVVDSCFISFQKQASENSYTANGLQTDILPELDELQFLYSNNTNTNLTYIMRSQPEMIKRYLEALRSAGHNNASGRNLKASNGFGVGISMPNTNLAQKSFNIQINSKADSSNKFNAYVCFSSLMEL
jgi:hypothetical protein